MTNSMPKSPNMLSLRISRWRQPRLSWLAVILVAVLCLAFGVVANALHPELNSAASIELGIDT
ncbi:MAG: hypothetical protein ACR2PZ_16990 [Pseudomonadales bacterium]